MGFPFTLIGNIGKALFGGGSSSSAGTKTTASPSSQPDYTGQIALMQAQAKLDQQAWERKQSQLSAQESAKQKKLLTMLGVVGVIVLVIFFVMGRKK